MMNSKYILKLVNIYSMKQTIEVQIIILDNKHEKRRRNMATF